MTFFLCSLAKEALMVCENDGSLLPNCDGNKSFFPHEFGKKNIVNSDKMYENFKFQTVLCFGSVIQI